MKRNKIIYWTATGLFSLMMTMSAFNYFTNPEIETTFNHLGFPGYFRIELGIAKILGVIALVLPFVPRGFKQFAYAGFTINMLSASVAHASKGDGTAAVLMPIILLGILVTSYIYYEKLSKSKLATAV